MRRLLMDARPGPPDRPTHPRTPRVPVRVRAADLASLIEVEAHASSCTLCRLCRDRTHVVTGTGPTNADVLVVTEAPGYHEDRVGEHLVGRTGASFDELIAVAGLRRDRIFLTSVVKCRPSAGRAPFPDEVEACEGWLFREISLVRPRVIVTLGALALRLVTGRPQRLADVHGTPIDAQVRGRDVIVWPLMHPAAALHAPRLHTQLLDDARGLGALLMQVRPTPVAEEGMGEGGGEHGADEAVITAAVDSTAHGSPLPPDDPEQQLSMFDA